MRKISLFLTLFCLLAVSASGSEYTQSWSSGEQTSDTIIYNKSCNLSAIVVTTDGSNDATAVLYDNTAASGKIIARIKVKAADNFGGRNIAFPVEALNGVYLDITGTGATAIVEIIK